MDDSQNTFCIMEDYTDYHKDDELLKAFVRFQESSLLHACRTYS